MTKQTNPVLIVGGSGVVGSEAAKILRGLHPSLPITLGGRDLEKTEKTAADIGNADAVTIDLERADLGLVDGRAYSAIALFLKDENLKTLGFAQDRGVPYVSISSGLLEIAPEVTAFVHRPLASAVLVASHVLAGAVVLTTLELARSFGHLETVHIGVLLDEQDGGGPAATSDFERLSSISTAGLVRHQGRFAWLTGDAARSTMRSFDGTRLDAQSVAVPDITSLALATGAPTIRLDMAVGTTASRRKGQAFPIEVVIALEGRTADGQPLKVEGKLVHPEGMRSLTALAVVAGIERLIGLDGRTPVSPGLYLPETLIDPTYFVRRATEFGSRLEKH